MGRRCFGLMIAAGLVAVAVAALVSLEIGGTGGWAGVAVLGLLAVLVGSYGLATTEDEDPWGPTAADLHDVWEDQ